MFYFRFVDHFNGYNDFKGKRRAAPRLNSNDLKKHSSLLFRMLSNTFTSKWGTLKADIEQLAIAFNSYSEFLQDENEKQKYRQCLTHPVRQISDNVTVDSVAACEGPVDPKYAVLDRVLTETKEYEPVYFDEGIHCVSLLRHQFLTNMKVSFEVDVLRFDPGAGIGQTVFIWRVPSERSPIEMMSSAAKMGKKLESRLPEYHTRQMKREFRSKYGNIAGTSIPPHILRNMYSELTLDASNSQNFSIDERLKQAILSDDSDIL
jgi:hypothetical protein